MPENLTRQEFEAGIPRRLSPDKISVGLGVRVRLRSLEDDESFAIECIGEIKQIRQTRHWLEVTAELKDRTPHKDDFTAQAPLSAEGFLLGRRNGELCEPYPAGYFLAFYDWDGGLAELTEHLLLPA